MRMQIMETNLKTTFGVPSEFVSGFFSGTAGGVCGLKLLRGTQVGGAGRRTNVAVLGAVGATAGLDIVSGTMGIGGANEGG